MHAALPALFLKGLLLALAVLFAALWSTSDMAATVHEWLKDLAPVVVSIAVLFVTWSFNKWQVRLAKQKLRHDLYERRMAIYVAFRELLIALPEKSNDEIKALLRKAHIARFEAPFLFADDTQIQVYLDELCKLVMDGVISHVAYLDAMNEQIPAIQNNPQVVKERAERVASLGAAKHDIPDRHLRELPQRFARSLSLTDFSA